MNFVIVFLLILFVIGGLCVRAEIKAITDCPAAGIHDYQFTMIGYWNFGKFKFETVCEKCGDRKFVFAIEGKEIYQLGYDPQKIGDETYYSDFESLKRKDNQ
jgi:hypothetical protein